MPYSRSYYAHFSFTPIFLILCHIPGQTMFVSHFPRFFQCSRHNPGMRVCISHFSCFWLFLTLFHVIQCLCLILQLLTFSRNHTGPTQCISQFYVSHCFLPHSKYYSVCLSFSTIFIFLPYSRSYSVHFSFSCFLMYPANLS